VLRRAVLEGGEEAHTSISVLFSCGEPGPNGWSLMQAEPLSGRTHQIRVHCSSEGFPIIGDPFYWEHDYGAFDSRGIRLASYAVRFFHPYRRELMTFQIPRAHRVPWLQEVEDMAGSVAIRYRERSIYEGH
jgi:23S rRNA-/tRNA-specific pseudouridylate synthase